MTLNSEKKLLDGVKEIHSSCPFGSILSFGFEQTPILELSQAPSSHLLRIWVFTGANKDTRHVHAQYVPKDKRISQILQCLEYYVAFETFYNTKWKYFHRQQFNDYVIVCSALTAIISRGRDQIFPATLARIVLALKLKTPAHSE